MKRLALALLLLMGVAPSSPARLEKTLANGVRLVVQQRGTVPWVALTTVLPGGSHKDPDGRSGLAHLAEHLLFEERNGVPLDSAAEELGMRSNAFTLTDYTILVEEFSPAVLEAALKIHAARVTPPVFSDTQLQREKRVVADERRFRVDEPALGRAEELLFDALWGGHAWGRPVLGWQKDVDAATREDVMRWNQLRVRPEHAVVVLVGAVDPYRAMRLLEDAMGAWSSPPPVEEPVRPPPAAGTALRVARDAPGALDALLWAVPAAGLGDPNEAADSVLAQILDGDPARRVKHVPEDWPPLEFRAEYRPQLHVGEILLTVVPHGMADLATAQRLAEGYLGLLATEGPDPAALESVRGRLLADHARMMELHSALAERLAVDAALLNNPHAHQARQDALRKVTPDVVKARAKVLLEQPRRALVRVHAAVP